MVVINNKISHIFKLAYQKNKVNSTNVENIFALLIFKFSFNFSFSFVAFCHIMTKYALTKASIQVNRFFIITLKT